MGKIASILFLSAVLILSGCTQKTDPVPTAPDRRGESETAQPVSAVDIGGSTAETSAAELQLGEMAWEPDALREAAPALMAVETVELGDCSLEELKTVKELFPCAALHFRTELDGVPVDERTESLDLRTAEESLAPQAAFLAGLMPQLREIILRSAPVIPPDADYAELLRRMGKTPEPEYDCSSLWSAESFALLQEAAPQAELLGQFVLYGQLLSCESEEVEIIEQNVGDEGLAAIRRVLPRLKHCRRFLLQDCNIDYALLDELRSAFPERNIVWRIHAGWCSAFTDTERIWMDNLTNESAQALQYCTKVKYLDLGHNKGMSDISFVEKMPELEVLILAMTGVDDLTPLSSCKKLEYLEVYSSFELEDLSPLAACTELQHLNIGNLPKVSDISCLYALPKLKRLRTGWDYIPREQKEEIKKLMPDCTMLFENLDPDQNNWRFIGNSLAERYALLLQQMQYGGKSPYDERDTAYIAKYKPTVDQAFTRS